MDIGLGVFPSARVFAAAVRQGNRIFLFGGTDGTQNFCDIWVFQIDFLRWERAVAIGPPPSPRYGHRIVTLDKTRIAVLGGCAVCPFSEGSHDCSYVLSRILTLLLFPRAVSSGGVSGGLMGMDIEETKALFDLQSRLEKNYKAEGHSSSLGGEILQSSIAGSTELSTGTIRNGQIKELLHSASSLAGKVSELEHETRDTELQLILSWRQTQANMLQNSKRARHPMPFLDVTILDTDDLVWKEAAKCIRVNKENLDAPCSRIHFAAVAFGGYIIVVGGLHPTCLKNIIVDDPVSSNNEMRVHVLDPNTQKWTVSKPKQTAQYIDTALSIAEADLIRARQRCEAEHCRGLSLGALNGQTVELAEAEAVLDVCQWRKHALMIEKQSTRPAPVPCWGANGLELVRQRAYLMGGWDSDGHGIPMCGESKAHITLLDCESEGERTRRLADEFGSKLELEQRVADEKAKLNKFLSAAELRILKEKEMKREAIERRLMCIQDILSSLPPLSKPNPVEFVKSNEHTIWVRWDRVNEPVKLSTGRVVDPKDITYRLYMRSEFHHLLKGDRVVVIPLEAAIKTEELRKDKMHTHAYRARAATRASNSSRMSNNNDFAEGQPGSFSPTSSIGSPMSRIANEDWTAIEAASGKGGAGPPPEVKMFPGEILNSGYVLTDLPTSLIGNMLCDDFLSIV
jgi:hypothetical protein